MISFEPTAEQAEIAGRIKAFVDPFWDTPRLTPRQVDVLRGVIHPEIRIESRYDPAQLAILGSVPSGQVGVVWVAVLGSSLMVIMGLTRAGVRLFWHLPDPDGDGVSTPPPQRTPAKRAKTAAAWLLVGYGLVMTLAAGPLMHYTDATARQLLQPGDYLQQVRGETPQMRQP